MLSRSFPRSSPPWALAVPCTGLGAAGRKCRARGDRRGAGAGRCWSCFFAPDPRWVRLPGDAGTSLAAQHRSPRGCRGPGKRGQRGERLIPGWFPSCIQQLKIICEHPAARGSPAVGSGRAPPSPVTSVLRPRKRFRPEKLDLNISALPSASCCRPKNNSPDLILAVRPGTPAAPGGIPARC